MIQNLTIYDRAIGLFDDPVILKAYYSDKIKWAKMMHRHLENGVQLFTNPIAIAWELVDVELPQGKLEIFTGETSSEETTYNSVTLSTEPPEGSLFKVTVKGIVDYGATVSDDRKTITFSKPIPVGTKSSVEWYSPGYFKTDFTTSSTPKVGAGIIQAKVVDILARALVISWAEKEKNFLLDIKNVLTDTDFKVYSPANSVKAKIEWVDNLRFELDTLQTKLGWDLISMKIYGGKSYATF